jgi:hypothetical protein
MGRMGRKGRKGRTGRKGERGEEGGRRPRPGPSEIQCCRSGCSFPRKLGARRALVRLASLRAPAHRCVRVQVRVRVRVQVRMRGRVRVKVSVLSRMSAPEAPRVQPLPSGSRGYAGLCGAMRGHAGLCGQCATRRGVRMPECPGARMPGCPHARMPACAAKNMAARSPSARPSSQVLRTLAHPCPPMPTLGTPMRARFWRGG